jgi:ATP-dependent DNA helicase RecG
MKKLQDTPIRFLKGIGPRKADVFRRIGINTVEDLLYHFPRRYEDRTHFASISQLKEGDTQTIRAEVLAVRERRGFRRRGFSILEITAGDKSAKVSCVWFNQPYLKEYFKVGSDLILYGKVERWGNRLQMNAPEFEIISDEKGDSLNIGRITPVYSVSEGITHRTMRRLIKHALDEYLPKISDFLPYDIRSRNNLLNLARSLLNIHFPESLAMQKEAYERLSFEEFFLFQIPLVLRKLKKKEKIGIVHRTQGQLLENFILGLPFRLTRAQERVIGEIMADMASPQAMQRLLQGDVGSGKTVVATIACLIAVQGGYQAAFMVPTEILARQHYDKISSQLKAQSSRSKDVKIGLLTGSLDKKEREDVFRETTEGKINLLIGTHALLEEEVKFRNLGLVVIDEQHKFGVGQRALLPVKGPCPDVLIMTATPIPRTLAITLYGDLDISVINELPPGRKVILTEAFSRQERAKAYSILKIELAGGRQAYIVYPVIEESYALDIAGAKKMYAQLKSGELKEYRLGLIHGRLKQKEQDEIMLKFKNRELDVLVSTTVLEVGIDIPNATCMVVEHAERFGLSQLHQLRGRVGRSELESHCLLISDALTQEARMRLEAMESYSDGFKIAEEDLKIRGPGEFFGKRQHGLSELKIANPLTQMQLLKRARDEAIKLLTADAFLQKRVDSPLKEKILQRFPEYEKLVLVG